MRERERKRARARERGSEGARRNWEGSTFAATAQEEKAKIVKRGHSTNLLATTCFCSDWNLPNPKRRQWQAPMLRDMIPNVFQMSVFATPHF